MYCFFGCFISPNFKSSTKLICLARQIYKNNLKHGIPCPLKCLAYNNIVFLHGSEIPYDIERFDNKWRAEYGYFSN